jgi:hypothetical protein
MVPDGAAVINAGDDAMEAAIDDEGIAEVVQDLLEGEERIDEDYIESFDDDYMRADYEKRAEERVEEMLEQTPELSISAEDEIEITEAEVSAAEEDIVKAAMSGRAEITEENDQFSSYGYASLMAAHGDAFEVVATALKGKDEHSEGTSITLTATIVAALALMLISAVMYTAGYRNGRQSSRTTWLSRPTNMHIPEAASTKAWHQWSFQAADIAAPSSPPVAIASL